MTQAKEKPKFCSRSRAHWTEYRRSKSSSAQMAIPLKDDSLLGVYNGPRWSLERTPDLCSFPLQGKYFRLPCSTNRCMEGNWWM